jgi:hypothetical protein
MKEYEELESDLLYLENNGLIQKYLFNGFDVYWSLTSLGFDIDDESNNNPLDNNECLSLEEEIDLNRFIQNIAEYW